MTSLWVFESVEVVRAEHVIERSTQRVLALPCLVEMRDIQLDSGLDPLDLFGHFLAACLVFFQCCGFVGVEITGGFLSDFDRYRFAVIRAGLAVVWAWVAVVRFPVFDPGIMPSVGTPEPGGLDWYKVINLLKEVFKNKNVVGCDVVELSPIKDNIAPDFLAARLVYKLIAYKFHKI